MPAISPGPSRFSHLVDAVTLVYSAAAVITVVLARVSALGAIGIIFALPVILAAAVRIISGLHFALTGRVLRVGEPGDSIAPPVRLGRPSWERRAAVSRASRRQP